MTQRVLVTSGAPGIGEKTMPCLTWKRAEPISTRPKEIT